MAQHSGQGTLGYDNAEEVFKFGHLVWDAGSLTWVRMTQPGAPGGAITIADGADVAQGNTTDVEAAGNGSVIAILKRIRTLLSGTLAVSGTFWQATQPVSGPLTDAQLRAVPVPVSGSFYQATQPVSAVALPLPSGAATEATLSTLNGKVTACNTGAVVISAALPTGANTIGAVNLAQYTPVTGRLPVDGSGVTQPVSAVALPLPSGASTEAGLAAVLAELSFKTEPADQQHVIVDSMPAAASAATATEESPSYTEAEASPLSQDLAGNLRTRAAAVVSESPRSYLDGDVQPLSLNSEGRLRVSVVHAPDHIEFFIPFDFGYPADIRALSNSPWGAL